jgi:hypothetical protein
MWRGRGARELRRLRKEGGVPLESERLYQDLCRGLKKALATAGMWRETGPRGRGGHGQRLFICGKKLHSPVNISGR